MTSPGRCSALQAFIRRELRQLATINPSSRPWQMPFALIILLAEAATLGHAPAHGLIQERFFDTLLGCLVGLLGAVALHNPVFRRVGSRLLRQLIPVRFLQV